jgi:hypothetical protein
LRYDQKRELFRDGQRVVYQLPTADALGLANYSQAREIKAAESKRKQDLAIRRFIRGAMASNPKKIAPCRTKGVG